MQKHDTYSIVLLWWCLCCLLEYFVEYCKVTWTDHAAKVKMEENPIYQFLIMIGYQGIKNRIEQNRITLIAKALVFLEGGKTLRFAGASAPE